MSRALDVADAIQERLEERPVLAGIPVIVDRQRNISTLVAAAVGKSGGSYLNDIQLTAVETGAAGNDISFEVLAPAADPQTLLVTVAGRAITARPAAASVRATGSIELAGVLDGDTVTAGGQTYTFRDSPAAMEEIQTGLSAEDTAEALVTAIGLHAGAGVAAMPGVGAGEVVLQAIATGTAGNSLPLAESTGGERISISGSTLTGGAPLAPTTTALELRNAVNASTPAAALVTASIPAGDTETGTGGGSSGIVTAFARTYLSGGDGPPPTPPAPAGAGAGADPDVPPDPLGGSGSAAPSAPPQPGVPGGGASPVIPPDPMTTVPADALRGESYDPLLSEAGEILLTDH